jgi:hypothetical protein
MEATLPRVLLARGFLTGTGAYAPPGSGATITIFDSTDSKLSSWLDGLPFNRITLSVYSSHDSGASGVVFSSSFDRGGNFRSQSATTYTNATDGARTWDYLIKGGHVKVAWTNSANVLTAWEMELHGVYDRNPGA